MIWKQTSKELPETGKETGYVHLETVGDIDPGLECLAESCWRPMPGGATKALIGYFKAFNSNGYWLHMRHRNSSAVVRCIVSTRKKLDALQFFIHVFFFWQRITVEGYYVINLFFSQMFLCPIGFMLTTLSFNARRMIIVWSWIQICLGGKSQLTKQFTFQTR